jgi:hypothetical protein
MRSKAARAAVIGAAFLLFLTMWTGCKSMSSEELKKSIAIQDMETKWVSKYYQPWPPRLILVPQISFRVKNTGAEPLTYVNFNAVFSFKGEAENFGDAFLSAIRGKPVAPGELSPVITMKSNFGVDGKDLKNIETNPMWKAAEVRLFARSKGSQFILLGIYDVSRLIDFKEPEAPQIKKDEGKK